MNLTYDIQDNVLHRLGDLSRLAVDREALNDELGRQLAEDLRAHFRMRSVDGPRNKLGAPSSGFWEGILKSVSDGETDSGGVTVTISEPAFIQKFYGGIIRMNNKLLAIPARTEAYNHSPTDFSNLKAVFFRSGAIALESFEPETKRAKGEMRVHQKGARAKKSMGLIYYWLARAVEQAPDPAALPKPDVEAARLLETVERHVNRIAEREQ
jgi:hypothetical protein